ncbi:glycoside hydrolase family 13 protein [Mycena floridula]|nr:glycoside hydrolase family 13 protein [Mycena floridula]
MPKGKKSSGKAKPSVAIPKANKSSSSQSNSTETSPISSISPTSPRTPADEAIEFFQSGSTLDSPIKVYELRLEADGGPNKDRSYIRLPPAYSPYILRVSLDAGVPAARNGVFKTNFPLDGGKFSRNNFCNRKLPSDFSKPIHVNLPISHAGAFVYWIEYDGEKPGERVKGREGYFNIDPALRIKARTPILSPESTPLPPSKGGLWKAHFAEAKERGYTMLHFTPLQERGSSDSPYSICSDGGKAKVDEILTLAREEYGLLSLTDVVLNHTANNSSWLVEHPEAGFSPANSPHLTPAFELDSAIIEFSDSLEARGLPSIVASEEDITTLMDALRVVIKDLQLWQYYVLDVTREKESVKAALTSGKVTPWTGSDVSNKTVVELAETLHSSDKIIGHGQLASRFGVRVEPSIAAGLVKAAFVHLSSPEELSEAWGRVVDVLNVPLYEEWDEDDQVALKSITSRLRYVRLELKTGKITKNSMLFAETLLASPLVEPYFTRIAPTPKSDPLVYSLANNGWIWGANPLENFALLPSKAYLRREVIVWGDCVKLRYGSVPEDNPWLWSHMGNYVTTLATAFDGFRLDNCHSTPLEETDIVFVKRLGINSLVRESCNGGEPVEYSRLLYRYGLGKPVGSMDAACLTSSDEIPSPTGKGPVRPAVVIPLNGSMPHAIMYDITHDNPSMVDKRSAEDSLSTAALVAFSYCAAGSVKGFDDLYPKTLELVSEKRKYELSGLGENSGIARVKRVLNELRLEMVLQGYEEGHVHQENDYIILSRGYLLVAHTAFSKGSKDRGTISPIKLSRTKATFVMGSSLDVSSDTLPEDKEFLKGLPAKLVEMKPVSPRQATDHEGPYSEITVPDYFPPGSIMVFQTQQEHDSSLDVFCSSGAQKAFGDLDLVHLNAVLHRAEGEERDATDDKFGSYDVPGLGKMTYCGLEGWMHPLRHIMRYNDLGHPLCGHLRDGSWALDYVHARLFDQLAALPNLRKPAEWFKERFERIKATVPPFLRPKYFALVISEAYKAARRAVVELSSEFVSSGHDFTQDLALCAVQMYGQVKSASLDPGKSTPSLAAGLPHFASGWARTWGRDRPKQHILAFSSTLKHGLIPNLLDSTRSPRYNSRDSPWWMLQNIQDYVLAAPQGHSILSEQVKRRFPKDDTWVAWDDPRAYAYSSSVSEIIQEILQRHADGIHFREYNAGNNLDMQMKDEGFNIDIQVDWSTGLISGGNKSNCGTWMDKMGESEKAGTKGTPGTPRDGAPVEITGLLKSTLRWLNELATAGKFPFEGVQANIDGKQRLVTYKEWSDLIQKSFEKCYYVPSDPADDVKYNLNSALVNRRGIYKDVYGSGTGREWSDYQLRPNFPIAMTVAPELFDKYHAMGALKLADQALRGPLGMKTLDPVDLQYRPVYDNQNDSTDAAIAKGLNYHNGPEWGWPLGYFLRAYLHFDTLIGTDVNQTLHHLHHILLAPRNHIRNDKWAGIPELTNENGQYCSDSCNTQAWSASTLLDFLETVHKMA